MPTHRLLPLLLLTSLLLGCKTPVQPHPSPITNTPTPVEQDAQRLQQCLKQIEVLKTLSTERYPAIRHTFDRLMADAAQYAGLRSQVNGKTQDTVDAMYRYRVGILCAEADQTVLFNLTERGGLRK